MGSEVMSSRAPKDSAYKVTMEDIKDAAKRLRNWGRWGKKDEIGTLNYIKPADVAGAAQRVKKGKVFSLALNYDSKGPQSGKTKYVPLGRFNPIHLMLRTGTDAYSGVLDKRGIRGTDDILILPLQAGTQWDGLGHILYGNQMYNGYDCRLVTSAGAEKNGIEKTSNKIIGRGVLLDMPRALGVKYLPDGFPITSEHLDMAARKHKVEIRRGDCLLVRTGQMQWMLDHETWDGYPGGDAAGLAFDTLDWLHAKKVAAIATDTWGAEVRPNCCDDATQPWHWIAIPIMGLTVGEIFYLDDLAADCAKDKRYEFMFVAPALPITGAVGSPVNPYAVK